jgi:hypothetical protein
MLVLDRSKLLSILSLSFALGAASCSSGDQVDSNFDTRVSTPAYTDNGPRVLFDEAHHNIHRAGKSYRPFVELIESDGYRVTPGTGRVTAESLIPYQVLVVACAMGTNERNDDLAFNDAECAAIRDWVFGGGAFLFITDHYPTGDAVENLAARFGVHMNQGVAEDSVQYDASFDPTHIVFSRQNGGLGRHPIVNGGGASQPVNRVLTFTGQALRADSATAFLVLSPSAVARPAQPKVERRGGDVFVNVEYGRASSATGWSQGLALEYGKGRVVVLGEAAMLTARLHRFDGRPIGMNTPGYDNRPLALNIMHWLTRAL